MSLLRSFFLYIAYALFLEAPILSAETAHISEDRTNLGIAPCLPYLQMRTHQANKLHLTISNFGTLGVGRPRTNSVPIDTAESRLGCEYPAGSGLDYLCLTSLWVGTIVGDDTLVTTGHDGWESVLEMFPRCAPEGRLVRRSRMPTDSFYSPAAISDLDYVAEFTDTLVDSSFMKSDLYDARRHRPLGLRITQESFSWGDPDYEDFVIIRYAIRNISSSPLTKVYLGVYVDADIGHVKTSYNSTDDISGHIVFPDPIDHKELFVAWSSDNDGDPSWGEPAWTEKSVRSAIGLAILDGPVVTDTSFNWWARYDPDYGQGDIGPSQVANCYNSEWCIKGTPDGDRWKYFLMANREIDYDQYWSRIDHSEQGWQPPVSGFDWDACAGGDTRFLYSFGPFALPPGDSTTFTFVIACGENLHRNPTDFRRLFNSSNPQAYYNSLDFSDLEKNILAAKHLYASLCQGAFGDADASCVVDISDIVFLINYLFVNGEVPKYLRSSDLNGDCAINLSDLVLLVRYLYQYPTPPFRTCETR